MKIGIYKPYKTIYFDSLVNDYAGWSREVVPIAQIFAERGHQIYMLSKTDLKKNQYKNIYNTCTAHQLDRIFFFNGGREKNKPNVLEELKLKTNRLDLLLTDLKLVPDRLELFNNIYTHSKRMYKYGGLAESSSMYNAVFEPLDIVVKRKNIKYYFAGAMHSRLIDFFEYVWRPDCLIHGKAEILNLNNRIGYAECIKVQKKSKYSIVIADIEYNKRGFITPRYFDNIVNDIISFVDYKYDPDEIFIKKNDWRRVESYLELNNKMNFLEKNPKKYFKLLQKQRAEVKKSYITGQFTYSLLK